MKKILALISLIAIVLSVACFTACSCCDEPSTPQLSFSVYVGLNDKTTGSQILSVQEAQEQLRAIIIEKGMGYTEYITYGAYTENGKVCGNDTVIYELFFVTEESVNEFASLAKERLNLASILIVERTAEYDFSK